MSTFETPKEFREVIDQVFAMLSTDPEKGRGLRDAKTPLRFEIPDLDLVVNITYASESTDGHYLRWRWDDEIDWEPEVSMKMDSDVANRYFQGKENEAIAIARRRVKVSGDLKKALALEPMTEGIFESYQQLLENHYPHLLD